MKVTYIYHSCFIVEFEEIVCIFDYYKGELPQLDPKKQIYFFASHKHQDHFSLSIFKYAKKYPNITYILSNDIKLSANYLERHGIPVTIKDQIIRVGKNKTFIVENSWGEIKIETLRSTDQGVAFCIQWKDKTIYHAGDLNWWSWHGETEEEYSEMTEGYINEINKLKDRVFDIAFVVLDPRQEERYWWGLDYFMKMTNTKCVLPMHCWEDYNIIKRLIAEKSQEDYIGKVKVIDQENQEFIIY